MNSFAVPSQWYSSVIGFYAGIFYGMHEKEVDRILNRKYWRNLFLLLAGFGALFCMRLLVSIKITDAEVLHGPFRSIIDLVFILFVISLLEIIVIRKNALNYMGKISYEIYLVHPLLIYIFRDQLWMNEIFCMIIFAASIAAAYLLNAVNARLSKMILKG